MNNQPWRVKTTMEYWKSSTHYMQETGEHKYLPEEWKNLRNFELPPWRNLRNVNSKGDTVFSCTFKIRVMKHLRLEMLKIQKTNENQRTCLFGRWNDENM